MTTVVTGPGDAYLRHTIPSLGRSEAQASRLSPNLIVTRESDADKIEEVWNGFRSKSGKSYMRLSPTTRVLRVPRGIITRQPNKSDQPLIASRAAAT